MSSFYTEFAKALCSPLTYGDEDPIIVKWPSYRLPYNIARTHGLNVEVEVYVDNFFHIVELKAGPMGVSVTHPVWEKEKYDRETVANANQNAAELLELMYRKLQKSAGMSYRRICHCARHYKDRDSLELLNFQQKQIVQALWNINYNRYKKGMPRFTETELGDTVMRYMWGNLPEMEK